MAPMLSKTSEDVYNGYLHAWSSFGQPKTLRCDGDAAFGYLQGKLREKGCVIEVTSRNCSFSNGKVERELRLLQERARAIYAGVPKMHRDKSLELMFNVMRQATLVLNATPRLSDADKQWHTPAELAENENATNWRYCAIL